jgi:hypothetical protein
MQHSDTVPRWWPLKHWTPFDVILIVIGSATCITLAVWLRSLNAWWARALETYVFAFVLCGGGVGAYGGWALDDVDDPARERKIILQLVAIAIGCPLMMVLGRQALGTPFDGSPGDWPSGVDLGARIALSLPMAVAALFFLTIPVRRRPVSLLVWVVALLFATPLALLAAWPWLQADFPIWLRISICGVALTAAVVLSKRIVPKKLGRGGN